MLEICFEPSTTPCGHSFCRKCLRSVADKCGKRCPKCRQLISNGILSSFCSQTRLNPRRLQKLKKSLH
ncbi:hypothetical protein MLD38_028716 [Melastoma candidum]|uniref:Uncharacterized protein n=1 Tax=Melastoma candidum TaxID=119954 RepID=A0ACB9N2E4_9MYRT|nr:hypothetical protein MLD38_028716 [Melastoma candidum]